ncbi:Bud site selection protein BUD4 [Daldinia childiae]|uniref:Bud site selection protein BUD4 n=2 Tax=Daldinia childiae TaxID=326645 RepID=UPI0014464E8F|nr:Bud site selection protein BUD4 [Daldinia childiae]KAF3064181.1 Bud site selection protein BUD4 [Daldinia childiae]
MASDGQPVTQPLRIAKNSTPSTSPIKSSIPRPLSEISATEQRRNSPSWNPSPKKMGLNTDSSPFQSSPLDGTTSPRLFWQNRNVNNRIENELYGGRAGSPSPTRRSSIERLQKASRVKNSTMFAREQKQEYDPMRIPTIERPLAKVQGNAFANNFRSSHGRSDSQTSISLYTPTKTGSRSSPAPTGSQPPSPSKDQASPTKSSLSSARLKSSQDLHSDVFSDMSFEDHELPSGRSLHRHAKSVTFDAAPPQINEYEMATPDMSSVGTNSREGSYEDDEDDDDDYIYGHYPGGEMDAQDDSFDATLEDTDKTPVVGPDDWRQDRDTRFDSSPMPEGALSQAMSPQSQHSRTDSSTSSNEHRPLPPLPGMGHARSQSASSNGLSATAERMLGSPRSLPSPPPASISKSDIHNIGNGSMSLEERLKLMMLDETSPKSDSSAKTFAEQQRERRMRRAGARDRVTSPTPDHHEDHDDHEDHEDRDDEGNEEDDTVGDLSGLDMDYQLPSISRQSILRRVNGNRTLDQESEFTFLSPGPEPGLTSDAPYDPDVPIASIEDSILDDGEESNEDSVVHHESEDDKGDVYDLYQRSEDEDTVSQKDDQDDQDDSDDHDDHSGHDDHDDDDTESQYSDEVERPQSVDAQPEEESVTTPRAASPAPEGAITNFSATLPQITSSSKDVEFTRSLQSHMLPKPKEAGALTHSESHKVSDADSYLQRSKTPERPISKPVYDGSGWGDPEEDEYESEEPGTPESVIHHPISDDDEEEEEYEDEIEEVEEVEELEEVEVREAEEVEEVEEAKEIEEFLIESPAIPEREATIKSSSGSKLKTRASATPSDIMTMREARRQVSREVAPVVPPIPDRHRNRLSRDLAPDTLEVPTGDDFIERHPSFKQRSLTLDLDLGLSLDQDFERVIEAQKVNNQFLPHAHHPLTAINEPKRQASGSDSQNTNKVNSYLETIETNIEFPRQRGYLMRQNTKLVTASDKETEEARPGTRSAGNSPIKQQRPQSWTVEPWNGKHRKSIKKRHAPSIGGQVPPLPGHESNSIAMNSLPEEDSHELATEECGERGRLFVKVMGVKDLDLPLPKNERTWFSLTLDNGVHCVTTSWLELARNAPIGQEFELVVPNELEFQLTLNVKLEKPPPERVTVAPTKALKPKPSTFSRVFASPKKRKEMEARQRAEEEAYAQAQRDAATKQRNVVPTAWDLLSPLAAEDGTFARAYVCLKEHESRCYGRPYMAEIATFNEWATEEPNFANSVKSKRSGVPSNSVVRRAPYKIGKLEVQLLFVPRPKGSTNDDMPKSMNMCIRELKAAEERLSRNWEGHLSQQGGDCPYWRRRYFKLVGTKLTAYHETTRQPRATINLSNAKRLIDDRRQLTDPETTGRGGKRRRSAFAEEEEGYMFVEEGFRIRFNNGEIIDFYADTREDKQGWMKVLGDVIGRTGEEEDNTNAPSSRRKWCELVLKREEMLRKRAETRRVHSRTKSMIV